MIYIEGISNDPYFNLAMEQYVFDCMDKAEEYFMLWQNDNSIIIGKHQNPRFEVNEKFVIEKKIRIARRLSGGGAVYHDMGNLNFTFVVNDGGKKCFDFSDFCKPVISTLSEIGVTAEMNGRNDITINGRKFSGNAQYRKLGRTMHHGTIMYDSNLDILEECLAVSGDKLSGKGVKSVRSRVTNVISHAQKKIPLDGFKEILIKQVLGDEAAKYNLSDDDIKKINEIKDGRYGRYEWNMGESPLYNVLKEKRFPDCGKVQCYINTENGVIKSISIYGDYFGNGEVSDIADALTGVSLEKCQLEKAMDGIGIENYIYNLSKEQFVEMLTE